MLKVEDGVDPEDVVPSAYLDLPIHLLVLQAVRYILGKNASYCLTLVRYVANDCCERFCVAGGVLCVHCSLNIFG